MINKIKSISSNRPYITTLVSLLLLIPVILFLISYFGFYVIESYYHGFNLQYKFGYCSEVKDRGFRLQAYFKEIFTKIVFFIKESLIYEAIDKSIDRYASIYPKFVKPEDLDQYGNIDRKKFVANHSNDPVFKDLFIKYLYLAKFKEGDLQTMEVFIHNLYHYIDEFDKRVINRKYKISYPTFFYEVISNDKDLLCDHLFKYYLSK